MYGEWVEAVINEYELAALKKTNHEFNYYPAETSLLDFPTADEKYHNYSEMTEFLQNLAKQYPQHVKLVSIGKSVLGKDLFALHFYHETSTTDVLPAIVFMGGHHAREHLSIEVPLYLANYLLENASLPNIKKLLETREIWIIPLVNPDGAEYDLDPAYQMWRKNRKKNDNGSFGVDLNRNYGFQWGKEGSSRNPNSETYRGKTPFSEPETQAVRDFILGHTNIKMLISYHTFMELILYPWGYTYSPIDNPQDLKTFEKMAQHMAKLTGYTPQPISDLYLSSGDTTDWAYGERGIFSFTFELSPKTMGQGGFYPGDIIDKTVDDNIEAALYAIEQTGHPRDIFILN
ncbi:MAG TPA: M14 family metallopeptidase [Bdellovibrionota bacterium]|nr:M14 family metallopeptidase [Bdellovibrionota bacterium]